MTDSPILYSAPVVRAQLDDRKTQTRRTLETLRRFGKVTEFGRSDTKGYDWHFRDKGGRWHDLRHAEILPYLPYKIGDRLWVREAVCVDQDVDTDELQLIYIADRATISLGNRFAVNDEIGERWWRLYAYRTDNPDIDGGKTVPPIHMPRWASRLTNIVTNVRIQRLQDIGEEDAIAEGAWHGGTYNRFADDLKSSCTPGMWFPTATDWYPNLWDRINGAGAWAANPWVIAYTFRVIRQNIDQIEEKAA